MTTQGDLFDLNVCADCIMWIANGEEPADNGDNWSPGHIEAKWPPDDGWRLHAGGTSDVEGEAEPHFSWSQCEACGSRLGGDRHSATAWHCVPA